MPTKNGAILMTPLFFGAASLPAPDRLIFSPVFDEGCNNSYNSQHQQHMDKNSDDFKYQANDPANQQYCSNDKKQCPHAVWVLHFVDFVD
jgi:hypothetical protein